MKTAVFVALLSAVVALTACQKKETPVVVEPAQTPVVVTPAPAEVTPASAPTSTEATTPATAQK